MSNEKISAPHSSALPDNRYWLLALPILVVGIVLRQWQLGTPPFHPDEAIHAFFSQGFANYHYNPTYHGPLLYHLVAGIFGLIGENEFTARLVPSLLGITLLWMVLGPMRAYLGDRGALWSAALLAVSPCMVTYSRRLLHDSLVLVLTLGAVLCFLAVLDHASNTQRGRTARVGLAAFLICFLATKANSLFVASWLAMFWLVWKTTGFLAPWQRWGAALATACWIVVVAASALLPRANTTEVIRQTAEHFWFQVLVLITTAAFLVWLWTRQPGEAEKARRRFHLDLGTTALVVAVALGFYLFLFGNVAQVLAGAIREPGYFIIQAGEGLGRAATAVPQMWEYWGGQQAEPRLPGRHDYYFILFLLYELPLLLVALGGIWYANKHRTRDTDLLAWWAFSTWAVYAVANEKVPWLMVHMALPLALLGGFWLGKIFDKLVGGSSDGLTPPNPSRPWGTRHYALLGASVLGVLISLRGVSGTNFEKSGDNAEPMFYAQTPDEYRDALASALERTLGDNRQIWLNNDLQWPTVWYLRPGINGMDRSRYTFSAPHLATPDVYRFAITEEKEWRTTFLPRRWQGEVVNFLIWPRASWGALKPHRFVPWFLYRDTLPAAERDQPQSTWDKSILSENGEWSAKKTVVGTPAFF